MNEPLLMVLLAIVGIGGSALCSGLETGFYAANRVRLALDASRSRRAAALRHETEHPERLLGSLLIGNNLFNYFGVLGLTGLLEALDYSELTIFLLNAVILTPVLLIVAESIPKNVFRLGDDRLIYACTPALVWLRRLLTWIGAVPLVTAFASIVGRLLKASPTAAVGQRRMLAALFKEGAGQGALSESQSGLIDRALRLRDLKVESEMTPWSGVTVVHLEWSRDRILRSMKRHPHTRFPLVDRRGRVHGVVSMLDLLVRPDAELRDLVRDPARLGPNLPLNDALGAVRQADAPIGIVEMDDRPVGLVTMKDLVEPLTGELQSW